MVHDNWRRRGVRIPRNSPYLAQIYNLSALIDLFAIFLNHLFILNGQTFKTLHASIDFMHFLVLNFQEMYWFFKSSD